MTLTSRARGFTLIELLVTVTIIAILASGALKLTEIVSQRQKEQDLRIALRQIREGIDAYKKTYDAGRLRKSEGQSGYPHSLEELANGVTDPSDAKGRKIYFMRRLPRDPFSDPSLAAEQSWGLRSYESPPDEPREGKDVYDVYSRAPGVGLNGVPYRDW